MGRYVSDLNTMQVKSQRESRTNLRLKYKEKYGVWPKKGDLVRMAKEELEQMTQRREVMEEMYRGQVEMQRAAVAEWIENQTNKMFGDTYHTYHPAAPIRTPPQPIDPLGDITSPDFDPVAYREKHGKLPKAAQDAADKIKLVD